MTSAPLPLSQLVEPRDYFTGVGHDALPLPTNILLFLRRSRDTLQQNALQNRSHHRHVLAFCLNTPGTVHVDNLAVPLTPGQALLILPYQFHHFSQLAAHDLSWLFCTFELSPNALLHPLRHRILEVGDAVTDARTLLLQEWTQATSGLVGAPLWTPQLQTTLLRLLLILKREAALSAVDLPAVPRDSLLRAINRFMSERHGGAVGVPAAAAALGLSASRLRERFRQAAGVPLGAYLRNYRLNRAMALLRNSTLPIGEIAHETGFSSPQAFSRLFRRKTGHTPSAYRSLQP